MEDLIIYHHLGLGDHIICNGLVREIIRNNCFKSYKLIVKKHNLPSIQFMYRDIKNLSLKEVNNDLEADEFILKSNKPYMKIGFQCTYSNVTWDEFFYKQCNIPGQACMMLWDNTPMPQQGPHCQVPPKDYYSPYLLL